MAENALPKFDKDDVICRSKAMLKVIREMAIEHCNRSDRDSVSESAVCPPVQDHTCRNSPPSELGNR